MQIGLAMYTVRNSFARDPLGTLEKIAEAGYRVIEVANHQADKDPGAGVNMSLADFKAKTSELGIKVVGAHFLPSEWTMLDSFYRRDELVDPVIDFFAAMGSTNVSIPIDFFPTRDYLLDRCEVYNNIGKKAAARGMKLLYHNHYHEFQRFDGKYMLDIIMENTDPNYVGIELDAYWTIRGAYDPVEKIRDYGDRIAIIHEKDYPLALVRDLDAWIKIDQDKPLDYKGFHDAIKPEQFIEIGDGMIKVQDIIDAGNEFNVPYMLVEQDYTKLTEFESIRKSMANMKKMRGVTF